jgi:hypothetical protein
MCFKFIHDRTSIIEAMTFIKNFQFRFIIFLSMLILGSCCVYGQVPLSDEKANSAESEDIKRTRRSNELTIGMVYPPGTSATNRPYAFFSHTYPFVFLRYSRTIYSKGGAALKGQIGIGAKVGYYADALLEYETDRKWYSLVFSGGVGLWIEPSPKKIRVRWIQVSGKLSHRQYLA